MIRQCVYCKNYHDSADPDESTYVIPQERALELWAARGPQQTIGGLLVGECNMIQSVWVAMPANTRWIDAFFTFLPGGAPP